MVFGEFPHLQVRSHDQSAAEAPCRCEGTSHAKSYGCKDIAFHSVVSEKSSPGRELSPVTLGRFPSPATANISGAASIFTLRTQQKALSLKSVNPYQMESADTLILDFPASRTGWFPLPENGERQTGFTTSETIQPTARNKQTSSFKNDTYEKSHFFPLWIFDLDFVKVL
nr:uncharacterized protein LOC129532352 [Gorilla gorilla gorilla]